MSKQADKLIDSYSEAGVRMRLKRIYDEARQAKKEGREVRAELIIFLINE